MPSGPGIMPRKPRKAPEATTVAQRPKRAAKEPFRPNLANLGSHDRKPGVRPLKERRVKRSSTTKYDFGPVEESYIKGFVVKENGIERHHWPQLQELAEKYSIPVKTVYYQSATHAWQAKREAWQAECKAARDAADLQAIRESELRIRRKALKAAERIIDRLAAEEDGTRSPVDTADAQDMASLAGALRKSQEVANVAIGIPKDGVRPEAEAMADIVETVWSRMRHSRQEVLAVRVETLHGYSTPALSTQATANTVDSEEEP